MGKLKRQYRKFGQRVKKNRRKLIRAGAAGLATGALLAESPFLGASAVAMETGALAGYATKKLGLDRKIVKQIKGGPLARVNVKIPRAKPKPKPKPKPRKPRLIKPVPQVKPLM